MKLVLNVYTDETLTEIKRTIEADRLKIPYRAALYVAQSLENVDLKSEDDIFNFIVKSIDKVDKVVKATFGVTDTELECVDAGELGGVAVELYKWAIDKINGLKGNDSKNVQTAE